MTLEEMMKRNIRYEPATGQLFWARRGRGRQRKRPIGYVNNCGYVAFMFCYQGHLAHRVAWFLYYDEWPDLEIDHIDNDKTNNRIENLRDVEHSVNLRNRRRHRRS